ncbi:hypothetical protein GCM10027610_064510 [Dactylosporangium cerinum]
MRDPPGEWTYAMREPVGNCQNWTPSGVGPAPGCGPGWNTVNAARTVHAMATAAPDLAPHRTPSSRPQHRPRPTQPASSTTAPAATKTATAAVTEATSSAAATAAAGATSTETGMRMAPRVRRNQMGMRSTIVARLPRYVVRRSRLAGGRTRPATDVRPRRAAGVPRIRGG